MGANFEVRELSADEYRTWDDLVVHAPEGTVFHSSSWVTTSARFMGWNPTFIGCFSHDHLVGGCPLYSRNRTRLIATATSVLPMTPFAGFCMIPSDSPKGRKQVMHTHAVLDEIGKYMKSRFDVLSIINAPECRDIRPLIWDGWTSAVWYTHLINLQEGERLESRDVRQSSKTAEKYGIQVRKELDSALFCDLSRKTYERQGLPPVVPDAYLKGLVDMCTACGQGEMWIARTAEGIPASAAFILWDSKRAHNWSMANEPALKESRAGTLTLTTIFQDLKERGFQEMNLLGGNMANLTTFYSAFSPRLVPYFQVSWANRKGQVALMAKRSISGLLRKG